MAGDWPVEADSGELSWQGHILRVEPGTTNVCEEQAIKMFFLNFWGWLCYFKDDTTTDMEQDTTQAGWITTLEAYLCTAWSIHPVLSESSGGHQIPRWRASGYLCAGSFTH